MMAKRVVVEATAAQSTLPCHIETSIPGTLVAAGGGWSRHGDEDRSEHRDTRRDDPHALHARWVACTHLCCAHEDNHKGGDNHRAGTLGLDIRRLDAG